jgi:ER-bound oxygenase mpaB/B'/Rubber oxygenase, catalytic domain
VPHTTEGSLSPAFLDRCRLEGDPPADDLVESLFRQGTIDSARAFVAAMVQNGVAPQGPIRDAWRSFVASEDLGAVDNALLRRAEAVFRTWGPQITLALCFGSLAGGYAASRVSHMLLGVSRLESDAARRVFETAQMLFDVLGPGSLEVGGRGIETAQRVRLMHAAVRRLMREHLATNPGDAWLGPAGETVWEVSWGVPINQEDMIGTIMTMSVHVLGCLKVLGVRLSADDRWAYVYAWLRVARIMGVKESLIPRDLREAEGLWGLTKQRHFAASSAGVELAEVLLGTVGGLVPGRGLRFVPRGLVWKLNGADVAEMVGVPPLRAHERLGFALWLGLERTLSTVEARNRLLRNKFGSAGTVLVRRLDSRALGGQRPAFAIPDSLSGDWALHTIRKRT